MNQGQSEGTSRTEKWIGQENLRPSRYTILNRENTLRVRLFWA